MNDPLDPLELCIDNIRRGRLAHCTPAAQSAASGLIYIIHIIIMILDDDVDLQTTYIIITTLDDDIGDDDILRLVTTVSLCDNSHSISFKCFNSLVLLCPNVFSCFK